MRESWPCWSLRSQDTDVSILFLTLKPAFIFSTHVTLGWANQAINLEATLVSKPHLQESYYVWAGTAFPRRPSFCSSGSHQTCIIPTTLGL